MKERVSPVSKIFSTLILIAVHSACFAFTPMDSYVSRVVGGHGGFKDGDFNEAQFNLPADVVFDDEGKRLFVADQGNNRVRVIHTDEDNWVETLAGTGIAGSQDGPLSIATFNAPSRVNYIKGGLVVYDAGDHLFRTIDLKSGSVSLLVSAGSADVCRTAYCPIDDHLYFTDPTNGLLVQMDLQKKTFTNILQKNTSIPNPKAICYSAGFLYIADAALSAVYRIPVDAKTPLTAQNVSLNSIGSGNKIDTLAPCNGKIYALQLGTDPIAIVSPSQSIVGIPTAFGFFAQTNNGQAEPIFDFNEHSFCGLTSSPLEPRKLYICGMSSFPTHSVYSFKDYDYANHWIGIAPNDYDYPQQKPPKTYRIMVCGDSRVVTAPRVDPKDLQGGGTFLTDTYAKKLELMLNTQAALNNVDTHFEVLILSQLDENPTVYGNYLMPDIAKKYDIDLFLPIASCNYKDYFRRPITSEGLPAKIRDMEYVLKPQEKRIPTGPAGDLYRIYVKQHLGGMSDLYDYGVIRFLDHPDVRDCLNRIFDNALGMLIDRLKAVKLSDGSSPKLVFTYIPWDAVDAYSDQVNPFLKELYQRHNASMLDIKEEFDLLRTAYSPTQQNCCDHHWTAYGNELIATLLCRHLIQDKIIPFEPVKKATP